MPTRRPTNQTPNQPDAQPTRELPLTGGHAALVDAADYDRIVAVGAWRLDREGYVVRTLRTNGTKSKTTRQYLHRFVLGLGEHRPLVDHVNGVRTDCRRSNLRLATPGENARNAATPRNNTSGVKGVIWHRGRWRVQIRVDGRSRTLGDFRCKLIASIVVAKAREALHAEFASHR